MTTQQHNELCIKHIDKLYMNLFSQNRDSMEACYRSELKESLNVLKAHKLLADNYPGEFIPVDYTEEDPIQQVKDTIVYLDTLTDRVLRDNYDGYLRDKRGMYAKAHLRGEKIIRVENLQKFLQDYEGGFYLRKL